jgi:hypothetical protein
MPPFSLAKARSIVIDSCTLPRSWESLIELDRAILINPTSHRLYLRFMRSWPPRALISARDVQESWLFSTVVWEHRDGAISS